MEVATELTSFENKDWGIIVTGGVDHGGPLEITRVHWGGKAQRGGISSGDFILTINGEPTDDLTLQEAKDLIDRSGKHIVITVGSPIIEEIEEEPEPEPVKHFVVKTNSKWGEQFPWSDKKKIIYKESNTYLVPSIQEPKIRERSRPQTPVPVATEEETPLPAIKMTETSAATEAPASAI